MKNLIKRYKSLLRLIITFILCLSVGFGPTVSHSTMIDWSAWNDSLISTFAKGTAYLVMKGLEIRKSLVERGQRKDEEILNRIYPTNEELDLAIRNFDACYMDQKTCRPLLMTCAGFSMDKVLGTSLNPMIFERLVHNLKYNMVGNQRSIEEMKVEMYNNSKTAIWEIFKRPLRSAKEAALDVAMADIYNLGWVRPNRAYQTTKQSNKNISKILNELVFGKNQGEIVFKQNMSRKVSLLSMLQEQLNRSSYSYFLSGETWELLDNPSFELALNLCFPERHPWGSTARSWFVTHVLQMDAAGAILGGYIGGRVLKFLYGKGIARVPFKGPTLVRVGFSKQGKVVLTLAGRSDMANTLLMLPFNANLKQRLLSFLYFVAVMTKMQSSESSWTNLQNLNPFEVFSRERTEEELEILNRAAPEVQEKIRVFEALSEEERLEKLREENPEMAAEFERVVEEASEAMANENFGAGSEEFNGLPAFEIPQ